MTARIGRTIPALAGFVALVMLPSTGWAQGNSFNPYGNSGYADYREFGNPAYPTNPSLPGQARLSGEPLVTRPRPNSYQQYTQDLNGDSDAGSARRGSNLPYYQAYQQLNSRYNRVYRPNDTRKDREFEDRLKQRDAAYAKALAERDPIKRAKLLRELEQSSVDRMSPTARARAAASTTNQPRQSATNSRAPSPNTASAPPLPGERPAPTRAPSSGATQRRSSTSAPATRTPAPPPIGSLAAPGRTDSTIGPAPDPSTIIPPPR